MSWREQESLHLFAAQRQTMLEQAMISWHSYGVFSGWKLKGGSWSLMPCIRLSNTSLTQLRWRPGSVNRNSIWWMKRKGRCVSEGLKLPHCEKHVFSNKESKWVMHCLCSPQTGKTELVQAVQIQLPSWCNNSGNLHRPASCCTKTLSPLPRDIRGGACSRQGRCWRTELISI